MGDINVVKHMLNKMTMDIATSAMDTSNAFETPAGMKRPADNTSSVEVEVKKNKRNDTRFDIREGGWVRQFICTPVDKIDTAIEKAASLKGIKKVIKSDTEGQFVILFDPKHRFSRKSTCFNGCNWTVEIVEDFHTGVQILPNFQGGDVTLQNILNDIQLSKTDRENIPVINWVFATYGRMLNIEEGRDIYIIFTYDMLMLLGFYTVVENSLRNINQTKTDGENIMIKDYKEIFGEQYLPNGGFIVNPLKYRPTGNKVIVVKKGYITDAFCRCTSEKARSLASITARVFDKFLETMAKKKVNEIGAVAFEKTVAQPADEELRRVTKRSFQYLERALEAEKQTNAAQQQTNAAQQQTIEVQERMSRLEVKAITFKTVNTPIYTPYTVEDNQPRIGCVHISMLPPPTPTIPGTKQEPLTIKLVYVNRRDLPEKRRTLKENANELYNKTMGNVKCIDTHLLTLYGGIGPIQVRTVLANVFGEACDPSRPSHMKVMMTPNEVKEVIDTKLCDELRSSFIAGIGYNMVKNNNNSNTQNTQVLFVNEIVKDNIPKEDASYIDRLVSQISADMI